MYDPIVAAQRVQRVTHTDFNGTVIVHEFDEMGRLLSKTPSSASLLTEGKVEVSFTYKASGQRETMTDASGETEYTYDDYNCLWTKTVENGTGNQRTLTYLYDANDNIESITSSTGETALTYDYDELGRLKSANSTIYSYAAAGSLKTVA